MEVPIKISVQGQQDAIAALKGISTEAQKAQSAFRQFAESNIAAYSANKKAALSFSDLKNAITGAVATVAVLKIYNFTKEIAEMGAQGLQAEKAFSHFVPNVAKATTELSKATLGMVENTVLQQRAVKAMISGIKFDDYKVALQYASKFAIATGQDTETVLSSITNAFLTGRATSLKRAGIEVSSGKDMVKNAVDQMKTKMDELDVSIDDPVVKLQSLQIEIANLKDKVGRDAIPILVAWNIGFLDIAKNAASALKSTSGFIQELAMMSEIKDVKYDANKLDIVNMRKRIELAKQMEDRDEAENALNEVKMDIISKMVKAQQAIDLVEKSRRGEIVKGSMEELVLKKKLGVAKAEEQLNIEKVNVLQQKALEIEGALFIVQNRKAKKLFTPPPPPPPDDGSEEKLLKKQEAERKKVEAHLLENYKFTIEKDYQIALQGAEKKRDLEEREIAKTEAEYEKKIALARVKGEETVGIEAEEAQKIQDIKDKFAVRSMQTEDFMAGMELNAIKNRFTKERVVIQKEYDRNKKLLDKDLKDGIITQAQYDKTLVNMKKISEREIADMEHEAQYQALAQTTNMMQQVAAKHHEFVGAYKAMAITQTIIDTYKSAESIYAGFSTLPFGLGIPMGIAGAAAAIGFGLSNVQQIANQDPRKMAYGGVVTGGVPGQDSVPAMLMPGEVVYNPAHPNPALASMVNNTSSESHNYHIGSPQIIIHGNPSTSTISQIGEVTQNALLTAIRKAQNMGKLSASGLTVRG